MTNRSENEFWQLFKEFNHDSWFWHFHAAYGRPFSTMPPLLERIDRERAAELTILDWVVSLCDVQETAGNMFLVENPVGATSWNQPSIQRLRNAPLVFEDMPHLCMLGVKDPRSRRVLKRPVRYLTKSRELLRFVLRKCTSKHVHGPVKGLASAYRSSSRWHTRAWRHAAIRGVESDVVKRDLRLIKPKMWKWILQERPYLMTSSTENHTSKKRKFLKRYSMVSDWQSCRIHKNLGHPSEELLCRALRIGGANKVAHRAASELGCDVCSENTPPKSHLPAKLADTYTEFNQGVGVDLFMLADSDEQVFEFLNMVDLCHEI